MLALTVILIVTVFIVLLGSSYAYLYTTIVGEKTYGLTVKGFSLLLDETSTSESINLENSIPMSDAEGKLTDAYTFSITNEDTSETGYILYLDDVVIEDEVNRLEDTKVKYQLIENDTETVGLVSELGVNPLRILSYGILGAGNTNNYSLRFWIDEDAEVFSNQKFSVKLRIIATSTEVIESGKLNPGETIVTTPSGTTEMTNEQLQTYIEKYVENAISNVDVSCEDCQNIISDAFDENSAYKKGDYVIYNNTLYQFTSDKKTGVWNENIVRVTTVLDEITTISEEVDTKSPVPDYAATKGEVSTIPGNGDTFTYTIVRDGFYFVTNSTGGDATVVPFMRIYINSALVFQTYNVSGAYVYITSPYYYLKTGDVIKIQSVHGTHGNSNCIVYYMRAR